MSTDGTRKRWPTPGEARGVVCPRCGCAHLPVLNTRRSPGRIVRYRQCRHCGRRVTTYELTPGRLAELADRGP